MPETIGAIAWLANNEATQQRIIGGFNVYDCGDSRPVTYKQSYFGNARVDRAAEFCLRRSGRKHELLAPGARTVRMSDSSTPRECACPLARSCAEAPPATPEYHTSLDSLDVLSAQALADTVDTLLEMLFLLDGDLTLASTCRGEPCLSRHNIQYPVYKHQEQHKTSPVKALVHELDGAHSLLDICNKWDFDFSEMYELAQAFVSAGVARPVARGVRESRA